MRIPQRYKTRSFIRILSEIKIILSHVSVVHYSSVNIDGTDDSLQMEIDPSLTGQRSKTGRRNRKILTRKLRQEIGDITTDNVLEIFKIGQTLRRNAVWCRMRRQDKGRARGGK